MYIITNCLFFNRSLLKKNNPVLHPKFQNGVCEPLCKEMRQWERVMNSFIPLECGRRIDQKEIDMRWEILNQRTFKKTKQKNTLWNEYLLKLIDLSIFVSFLLRLINNYELLWSSLLFYFIFIIRGFKAWSNSVILLDHH